VRSVIDPGVQQQVAGAHQASASAKIPYVYMRQYPTLHHPGVMDSEVGEAEGIADELTVYRIAHWDGEVMVSTEAGSARLTIARNTREITSWKPSSRSVAQSHV